MTNQAHCLAALAALSCTAQPLNGDWAIDSAFSEPEQYRIGVGLDWWSGLDDAIDWTHHVADNPSGDWSVRCVRGVPKGQTGAYTRVRHRPLQADRLNCEITLYPDTQPTALMLRRMMIHEAGHCALQTEAHSGPGSVLSASLFDVEPCLTIGEARMFCGRYGCEALEIEQLCEERR